MFDFFSRAFDFLSKGGFLMIFILLCSVVAIVLFIERWFALRNEARAMRRLDPSLRESISEGQYERALTQCDANPCAITGIAGAAVRHRTLSREALQEAVQDEAKRQYAVLQRRIPAVGIIANISPLLGLLGTVTGMIQVFSNLADEYAAGAHANPGMLAGGIWEALLTTAAGLCVAIPAFLLHRILCGKLDTLWLDLEAAATAIVDRLAPPQPKSP